MCSLFAQPSQSIEYLEYLEMSLVPRGFCVCSEFGTVLLEKRNVFFVVDHKILAVFKGDFPS